MAERLEKLGQMAESTINSWWRIRYDLAVRHDEFPDLDEGIIEKTHQHIGQAYGILPSEFEGTDIKPLDYFLQQYEEVKAREQNRQ